MNSRATLLDHEFYQRDDVVLIARELLGKVLCSRIDGVFTSGIIVETEAYNGVHDKACHAHLGRFTKRTKVMYEAGGVSYIYLCYGIHHLFNVITNVEGIPDAVLIRAVEPIEGIETMQKRRNMEKIEPRLTAGPGVMSQALGLTTARNGFPLLPKHEIWIEDRGKRIESSQIKSGPRIGVGYASEDAFLPYRFWIQDNPWVSKAR